jgi:hypothetical protein
MMHWRGFVKKELWPNEGTVTYFQEGLIKALMTSISIDDDWLKI